MQSHAPESLEARFVRYRTRNDASALAEVFDATAPALLAIARRLSRKRGDAEDLLQATFVTAIERAETFDATRSIVPWLTGILAGHARNAARRAEWRAKNEQLAGRDARDPTAASGIGFAQVTDPGLLDSLVRLEERAAVARAVHDLPEPYRELLASRLAPEATASNGIDGRVGTASVALRVRLHRGIARLRRLLPASLFGALLGVTLERRAVAGVRARVLAHESSKVLGGAGAAASLGVLGASLMWKKVAVVAALLLACAWVAFEIDTAPPEREEPAATASGAPEVAASPIVDSPAPAERTTATEASPPDRRIRYRGRVLDGATLEPIHGAAVVMTLAFVGDEPPTASTPRTDATGRFEIPKRNIESGPEVRVFADGYAPLYRPFAFPKKETATEQGVEVGDLRLERGATVRGSVHDSADRPVAGARLYLIDHSGTSPCLLHAMRAMGTTDANGTFALANVRSSGVDAHRILALDARGLGGVEFTIAFGVTAVSDVRVRLRPNSPVEIEVVDDRGNAIEGASVEAVPTDPPFGVASGFVALSPSGSTLRSDFHKTTDATGRVRFDVMPSDSQQIFVVAETDRAATAFRSSAASVGPGPEGQTRTKRLILASAQTASAVPAKPTPADLYPLTGTVIDDAGTPVPGAKIHGGFGGSHLEALITDERGRFHVEATKGPRNILVDLPGGELEWRKTPLVLLLGESDSDVNIVGQRTPPGIATVTIDVHDADSHAPLPLIGASIYPRRRDPSTARIGGPDPILASGVKGRIVLERWRAGAWRIEVRTTAASFATLDFDVLPGDTSLHFELPVARSATVKGRIVAHGIDDATLATIRKQGKILGYEADGARLLDELTPHDLAIDAQDAFLFTSVPSREVRLRFVSAGAVGEVLVDARKGGDLEVELPITKPARVRIDDPQHVLCGLRPSLHLVPLDSGDSGAGGLHVHDQWIDLANPNAERTDTFPVLPGSFRFELFGDLFVSDADFVRRDAPLLMSGTITVAAGTTAEIVITK